LRWRCSYYANRHNKGEEEGTGTTPDPIGEAHHQESRQRLQARVLPARSEMVTTLIAQMFDLLALISKSTTRT
jgi:hypothetical protein